MTRYEKNEPLAVAFIRKYYPTLIGNEDYLQVVKMALWQACQQYDPKRKIKFSTFAYMVMRNKLLNELRRDRRSKRYGIINVSLEEILEKSAEYGDNDYFMDTRDFTDTSDYRIDIDRMLSKLTAKERLIIVNLGTDEMGVLELSRKLHMKQRDVLEMIRRSTAFIRDTERYDSNYDYGADE